MTQKCVLTCVAWDKMLVSFHGCGFDKNLIVSVVLLLKLMSAVWEMAAVVVGAKLSARCGVWRYLVSGDVACSSTAPLTGSTTFSSITRQVAADSAHEYRLGSPLVNF